MKKLLLSTAIAVFGLMGVNAQMEAGPYLGLPIGDADGFAFNAGATFGYYYEVIPRLKVGGIVGVDHFFGKEYEEGGFTYDANDATFIPIAASAKFNITDKFFAGLELGYAIGVTDAAGDGGFLYRPRVGFSLPLIDVFAFYKGINYSYDIDYGLGSTNYTWNTGSVGVGAAFKF